MVLITIVTRLINQLITGGGHILLYPKMRYVSTIFQTIEIMGIFSEIGLKNRPYVC